MIKNKRSPWSWVPSLYFAQGMPYVIVMTLAVILYKRLGISNTDIALYTSWLYLPWVIKPLWSPLVDLLKTKRWWIVTMQLLVGGGLAGVALTIPSPAFFQYTLAFFWLLAFSSATHDIAADGFYMLALEKGEQAFFIGIRSTFFRIAMITGQGLFVIVAGLIETHTGMDPVKFSVQTDPTTANALIVDTPTLNPDLNQPAFVMTSDHFTISPEPMEAQVGDSLKQWVVKQNTANGFVVPEPPKQNGTSSWFTRQISAPLGDRIKRVFNTNEKTTESQQPATCGRMLLAGIRLSQQPEKPVVLMTHFTRGDKSLKIIAGERLEFNSKNQDQTAWLLIQADPASKGSTAAYFEGRSGDIPLAWSITFYVLTGLFLLFFFYHRLILPKPATDGGFSQTSGKAFIREFFMTFGTFFRKKEIGMAIGFILLYRFGEAQLLKLAIPFFIDPKTMGGLGLTTGEVGLVYGTFGIIALTLGGILGGLMASRNGLKYWIFPMTLAMNAPNLVYVYLSWFTPDNLWIISAAVAIEQFGYGFGFTAFMLYLIYFSDGPHKTAHYAIATGLMALGMMIPGMLSGWLQELIGYNHFFIWVVICTIPGFIIIRHLKIDPEFGIRK
jgi:MFS transporter, PAT family, beta-lactamase induction signal transducer AmpG